MLEAIQGKSLTDEAEEMIYNYIKNEKLQIGDPMPKENELAKMLQVSRPMIREALSRLRMLGLMSSRKNEG